MILDQTIWTCPQCSELFTAILALTEHFEQNHIWDVRHNGHRRTTAMNSRDKARRRRALIKRDGPQCFWCAVPFSSRVLATLDHIIPRRKGGTDSLPNLVLACTPCNEYRSNPPLGRRRTKEDG